MSVAIHNIANFFDEHYLYLDEELALHSIALFIGVEDIHDADEDSKQELLDRYRNMRKEALRMISEDSGVAEINQLFKKISDPKIDGEFIRLFRKIKREAEQM